MNSSFIKGSSIYMLIHGIIAILIGLMFLFVDSEELAINMMQIFGGIIILAGIIIIWRSLMMKNIYYGNLKYTLLIQGILLTALGLFTVIYSDIMIDLIMLFIGIWAIISGGFQTYYGIKSKGYISSNKLLMLNGIFLLIVGFIIAFRHELFLDVIGTIIGTVSLITGFITLIYAFILYKMRNDIRFQDTTILDDNEDKNIPL